MFYLFQSLSLLLILFRKRTLQEHRNVLKENCKIDALPPIFDTDGDRLLSTIELVCV